MHLGRVTRRRMMVRTGKTEAQERLLLKWKRCSTASRSQVYIHTPKCRSDAVEYRRVKSDTHIFSPERADRKKLATLGIVGTSPTIFEVQLALRGASSNEDAGEGVETGMADVSLSISEGLEDDVDREEAIVDSAVKRAEV